MYQPWSPDPSWYFLFVNWNLSLWSTGFSNRIKINKVLPNHAKPMICLGCTDCSATNRQSLVMPVGKLVLAMVPFKLSFKFVSCILEIYYYFLSIRDLLKWMDDIEQGTFWCMRLGSLVLPHHFDQHRSASKKRSCFPVACRAHNEQDGVCRMFIIWSFSSGGHLYQGEIQRSYRLWPQVMADSDVEYVPAPAKKKSISPPVPCLHYML